MPGTTSLVWHFPNYMSANHLVDLSNCSMTACLGRAAARGFSFSSLLQGDAGATFAPPALDLAQVYRWGYTGQEAIETETQE